MTVVSDRVVVPCEPTHKAGTGFVMLLSLTTATLNHLQLSSAARISAQRRSNCQKKNKEKETFMYRGLPAPPRRRQRKRHMMEHRNPPQTTQLNLSVAENFPWRKSDPCTYCREYSPPGVARLHRATRLSALLYLAFLPCRSIGAHAFRNLDQFQAARIHQSVHALYHAVKLDGLRLHGSNLSMHTLQSTSHKDCRHRTDNRGPGRLQHLSTLLSWVRG